jgi:RNA polymerase sigma-70 factor (family 1)
MSTISNRFSPAPPFPSRPSLSNFPYLYPPEQPSPQTLSSERSPPARIPYPQSGESIQILPTTSTYNEPELLRLTARGDEQAFAALFEHYTDTLYGVALHYTKIPESAEELVQDVFTKLWIKRASLPTSERFNDWLFILTRNHILDFLQKNARQQKYREELTRHFQDSAARTPEQEMLFKESAGLIARAVASLPPQQQKIFDLSRNQGLNPDQIAERLGLSRNTVRNHLHRALTQIREWLQTNASDLTLLVALLLLALG